MACKKEREARSSERAKRITSIFSNYFILVWVVFRAQGRRIYTEWDASLSQGTIHTHSHAHSHLWVIYLSQSAYLHIFGHWEETRVSGENPCEHRESM